MPIDGRTRLLETSTYRVATMRNKVPEATLVFCAIKIMATTVGETGADYLAVHVGLGTALTGGMMLTLLIAALAVQLRMRKYVPWIYWLTVVLVSVVGTQITDALTDKLGISLYASTIAFSLALAVVFALWYRSERTLSIHTIYTTRRELFYWAAVLFTFALGTAAGDLARSAGARLHDRCGGIRRANRIGVRHLLRRRESGADVLACLHSDAAVGRFVRRSALAVARIRRSRPRHDQYERALSECHRRAGRLRECSRTALHACYSHA